MYKISVVSYLNSVPFKHGLENSDLREFFEVEYDIPSVCAEKLLSGKVDIGLVPVAILAENSQLKVISDYCIAANQKVKSVKLFSTVPLDSVETILLDHQSRTSNALCQVLCENLWQISPSFGKPESNFRIDLKEGQAAVIIGDRAFEYLNKFPFEYDLAEEWYKLTGLPFVFAAWVANREINPVALEILNKALGFGVEDLPEILNKTQEEYPNIAVNDYLLNYIQYRITEGHLNGLHKFLQYLA